MVYSRPGHWEGFTPPLKNQHPPSLIVPRRTGRAKMNLSPKLDGGPGTRPGRRPERLVQVFPPGATCPGWRIWTRGKVKSRSFSKDGVVVTDDPGQSE